MRIEQDTAIAVPDQSTAVAHRQQLILLALLLAASALIRLAGLGAFPEVEADEGLWTNSTKNFVAFGDWFMDERTHMLISPLFHALTTPLFWIAGPGIGTARVLSGLAGVASVLLLQVLIVRLDGRRHVALIAAALFGINQWTAITSRRALIEPLELCMMLLAAALLARRTLPAAAAAGVAMALALLAKLNAIFFLGILALYTLLPRREQETRKSLSHAASFALIGVALAAMVYGFLYLRYPARFVEAFLFELRGEHFLLFTDAVVRLGRFGIAPEQTGRAVLGLFRESPFLLVLAALGAVIGLVTRPKGSALFGIWLTAGLAYFVLQTYQPLRYFYLLTPALAYFGSLAIVALATEQERGHRAARRIMSGVLVATLGFELAYLGMNAVVNRAEKIEAVTAWVAVNTRPRDRIMAAGYLCTDIPRRAYAHYHYEETTDRLFASIRELDIDYVIVDNAEWRSELADSVAARFEPVQRWSFGTVYRTR